MDKCLHTNIKAKFEDDQFASLVLVQFYVQVLFNKQTIPKHSNTEPKYMYIDVYFSIRFEAGLDFLDCHTYIYMGSIFCNIQYGLLHKEPLFFMCCVYSSETCILHPAFSLQTHLRQKIQKRKAKFLISKMNSYLKGGHIKQNLLKHVQVSRATLMCQTEHVISPL